MTRLAYPGMVGAAVAAFLCIRSVGAGLAAHAAGGGAVGGAPLAVDKPMLHLLFAVVVVTAACRLAGAVFRRFHQPEVMGEVIAGLVLGPSLLGRFAPGLQAWVFPAAITPLLGAIAQLGMVFYMFLVGLHLDLAPLRGKARSTIWISHASILAPFTLGSVAALWLYPRLATSDVPFAVFALFMGAAMSVTAFPVLARILADRGIERTPVGLIAIGCAAIDDVTAWCLLAFVVGVAKGSLGSALLTVGLTAVYVGAMIIVLRPLASRALRHQGPAAHRSRTVIALALVGALASALTTELIGVHAVFGAFLFGAIVPREGLLALELKHRLEDLVGVLLLPIFFALTGLRTKLGLVQGPEQWLACALIILVACVGKFGGSAIAARASGLGWRDSASIGVLMNTRGLMELVILNVGLDLGVISPTLFAMLVIMAVATTLATTPALELLGRRGRGLAGAPAASTHLAAIPTAALYGSHAPVDGS